MLGYISLGYSWFKTTKVSLEKLSENKNFYEEKSKESESITYHLFEIYKDSVALDFHRSTAYFKNYRSKIEELLAKPIEVKILNSIDSI